MSSGIDGTFVPGLAKVSFVEPKRLGSAIFVVAGIDSELTKLESERPEGLTSQEILAQLASWGHAFSEASLRKYVQLGLLPRSVRIGEKGKHRGSKGIYPVRVVRQILAIRRLLASDLTIEQIKDRYLFLQGELDELEQRLFVVLQAMSARASREPKPRDLGAVRDLKSARSLGKDLMIKLRGLETRLNARSEIATVQEVAG